MRPISLAPADNEHPPGSSDEGESDDEEEEAESEGERLRRDVYEMAILNIDDELADDEVLLPLQIPGRYFLVSSTPAALTAALVKRSVLLPLGVGWLKGTIMRRTQAHTRHLYDLRVFLDSDGSTRSVKLPLTKYSVDGPSAEGSWVLLMRREGAPRTDEEESEEKFEEKDKEEEEGSGGGGGCGVLGNEGDESEVGGGGRGGDTGVPGADSEEGDREEDEGEGGSTDRNEMRR